MLPKPAVPGAVRGRNRAAGERRCPAKLRQSRMKPPSGHRPRSPPSHSVAPTCPLTARSRATSNLAGQSGPLCCQKTPHSAEIDQPSTLSPAKIVLLSYGPDLVSINESSCSPHQWRDLLVFDLEAILTRTGCLDRIGWRERPIADISLAGSEDHIAIFF